MYAEDDFNDGAAARELPADVALLQAIVRQPPNRTELEGGPDLRWRVPRPAPWPGQFSYEARRTFEGEVGRRDSVASS